MIYEVHAEFVFSGTFTIKADSAAQAKELVENYCWMSNGKIHSYLIDDSTDWKFNMNPEKRIGRAKRTKKNEGENHS